MQSKYLWDGKNGKTRRQDPLKVFLLHYRTGCLGRKITLIFTGSTAHMSKVMGSTIINGILRTNFLAL